MKFPEVLYRFRGNEVGIVSAIGVTYIHYPPRYGEKSILAHIGDDYVEIKIGESDEGKQRTVYSHISKVVIYDYS